MHAAPRAVARKGDFPTLVAPFRPFNALVKLRAKRLSSLQPHATGRAWGVLLLVVTALFLRPLATQAQLNRYYYYTKTDKELRRGEYTSAMGTINQFLRFVPNDQIGQYLRALTKYYLKDARGALLDLNPLLEQYPFMFPARLLRATVNNQLDQPHLALPDLQLAQDLRPSDLEVRYLLGITHFLLKQYEQAIHEFDATLAHQPDNTDAWLNRGTAKLLLQDTLGAQRDYQQVTQIDPFLPHPHIQLARTFYLQRDTAQALQELDAALQIDQNAPEALLVKGLVLYDMQKPKQAIALLGKALDYAPHSSLIYYNRAIMQLEQRNNKAALDDLKKAMEISPGNVYIQFNLGLLYLDSKRYSEAQAAFSRALVLYPHFARAYTMLAHTQLAMGLKKQAKQSLDSAQQIVQRYQAGKLDTWSDTAAVFSRLMAFESDFNAGRNVVLPSQPKVTALIQTASIVVGQSQPYKEWPPVQKADSLCGAPFFALMIPSSDTARRVDVSLFPKLNNAYAIALVEAVQRMEQNLYPAAIEKLNTIPSYSPIYPLGLLVHSVALINMGRYTPRQQALGTHPSSPTPPTDQQSYRKALELLQQCETFAPSPYIDYLTATAHYLLKDLNQAENALSKAIEANPSFAEAYYNRGLIRLLLKKHEEACIDLSLAGQIGLDQAYRAIAEQCTR